MEKEVYKIYKTCSPSETPVVTDVKNVLLITMSCGGGMGGSKWDELVLDDCKINSNNLQSFINAVNGQEYMLNTSNMVKIVPKQMLRVYDDVTAHCNFTSKTVEKAWNERIIVLDRDEKWECVDKYGTERNNAFETFKYRIPITIK